MSTNSAAPPAGPPGSSVTGSSVTEQVVTEQVVTVRGSDVRVLSAGAGQAVLYLHGSGDLGTWMPALDLLARRYRVIRPDLPGFNHSQPRDDIESVHDLAYWAWDLIDALDLDTVRVVGSSLGGWLAADLATIEPSRLSHLVLVGAAGLRPAGGFGTDVFVLSPPEVLARAYHQDEVRRRLAAEAATGEDDPGRLLLMLRNRAATARLAWNPYFHDPRLASRLHRIRARTLLVWGENDQLMPVACGRRYAGLIRSASLRVIPGCGHLPQVERTDQFAELTIPFLGS